MDSTWIWVAQGGLIRNQHRMWIVGFSRNIGYYSFLYAELWGALEGLQLAWGLGLKRVILKMDSTEVIQVIQANVVGQHFSAVIQDIKNLLQFSWIVKVTHTFRKGNIVTNGLALVAFSRPLSRYIFMQPLDEVLLLLHDDYSGMT
ncbi:hypothetical protein J1N35_025454 [Gossypium stocksii]|uniref:RNase H type-1 domain-containing protein n=1 Tax=Gossypium stocksii TaxID=47602 RepID=A0A9D3ZXP0_9ROSI|nr:hypothetical protein J1N35_025454 [Gossypium stocksii]